MGRIFIKQGDITREEVEVIVNAANTGLRGGGGVDGAIHSAAGPSVMEECRRIGGCKTGEAVITCSGMLPAKKIIHTPGPVWKGGGEGEPEQLRSCYENCFKLAVKKGLGSIAFPAISTGIYRYPVYEAAKIAIGEGVKWVNKFKEIRYICFSSQYYKVYNEVYGMFKKD